jgi:hypothetical protein
VNCGKISKSVLRFLEQQLHKLVGLSRFIVYTSKADALAASKLLLLHEVPVIWYL